MAATWLLVKRGSNSEGEKNARKPGINLGKGCGIPELRSGPREGNIDLRRYSES